MVMKFDFEKVKKVATKTAIGAGVVSASLGSLEAQEVKSDRKEKELNETEIVSDTTQNQNEKESIKKQTDSIRLEKIKEIENDLGISKENKDYKEEIEKELENQDFIDRRKEIFGKDGVFSFFEDQNRPENNEDFNKIMRNRYIEYIKDPSYKERLKKEMYGDKTLNEEEIKEIDKEYEERLKQAEKVSILTKSNISAFEGSFNSEWNEIEVGVNENAFNHEFSHAVEIRPDDHQIKDDGFSRILKSFNLKEAEDLLLYDNMVNIKKKLEPKFKEYLQDLQKDSNYIYNNDLNKIFKENTVSNIINTIEKQYRKNFIVQNIETINNIKSAEIKYFETVDEVRKYLIKKTEIKARLNSLRMMAKQKYNYQLEDNFNINDYPLLKEDYQYKQLKQIDLSDEQINELMKYTAMNENEDGKGNYYNPNWNYNNEDNKA
ncbi:MAG: hypothetical protein O210_OD1C00001G0209 [Parcubacteria bacterium RAAC4_OD1_1]|nr:MAG: hypothetical protein O210_OD1C00001G0209 [Parcubacteria bacterium RAAC4_OD1_1]